jgi:hypothetical protein
MAHGSIFKICHSMIWDGRALFKKNVCLVKENFGLVIETWVSGLSSCNKSTVIFLGFFYSQEPVLRLTFIQTL